MKKINKKLPIIVAGLSAIALGTVGFSTWILGVTNKTDTLGTTVNVETVKNRSIDFKMTINPENATINLGDGSVSQGEGGIASEGTADLEITANAIIKVTGDYLDDNTSFTNITYAWGDKAAPIATENKFSNKRVGTNFINFPAVSNLSNLTKEAINNATNSSTTGKVNNTGAGTIDWSVNKDTAINTYTLTGSFDLSFTWGDYFDNKETEDSITPIDFYKSLETAGVAEDAFTFYHNVEVELEDMAAKFNQLVGKEINISATIA